MANSIQQAKIAATPSEKVKTNELAGRVRVAFAEYEASAEQSTIHMFSFCLLYTSPSPRDRSLSRMPSSA